MSPVKTPLLDRVRYPADLRNFSPEQLRQVADELRTETIDVVSVTGGHFGASLGVVELTVASPAFLNSQFCPKQPLLCPAVSRRVSICPWESNICKRTKRRC